MKKILIFSIIIVTLLLNLACPNSGDLLKPLVDTAIPSLETIEGANGIIDDSVVSLGDICVTQDGTNAALIIEWDTNIYADSFLIFRADAREILGDRGRIIRYEIYEKPIWEEIASITNSADSPVTSYKDTDITTGKGYAYTAIAIKSQFEVLYESKASTVEIGALIHSPLDSFASLKESFEYISVQWSPIVGAIQYKIYRATGQYIESDDGEGNIVSLSPSAPDTNYTLIDTTPIPFYEDLANKHNQTINISFFYKIAAVVNGVETDYTKGALAIGEFLPPGAIPPPANIRVSRGLVNSIEVTWEARNAVKDYVIYRNVNKNIANGSIEKTIQEIGRVSGNDTIFTDIRSDENPLNSSNHYWYSVSCINDKGAEGRRSSDILNADGLDNDGCLYANEGFILSIPEPQSLFIPSVADANIGISLVQWDQVPAASGYQVLVDGNLIDQIIHETIYINFLATRGSSYQVKAVKINSQGVEESTGPSKLVNEENLTIKGSIGKYTGSGNNLQGYVSLVWPNLIQTLFEATARIERKALFETNFTPYDGTVNLFEEWNDPKTSPKFDYVTMGEKIRHLTVNDGESNNDALIRFLSNNYNLICTREGTDYLITASGIPMFSMLEMYYFLKVADHSGSNKTTNKITSIFDQTSKGYGGSLVGNTYPTKVETDQGYYSGSLIFNPYKAPTISDQWAELVFEFKKMEDYPGVILDGTNYIWKDSSNGKLNSIERGQNPTLNCTLFGRYKIAAEERSDIHRVTSAVLGGYVNLKLFFDGAEIASTRIEEAQLLEIFADNGPLGTPNLLKNVPGGRNYTRTSDGANSVGHVGNSGEVWLDPVNCGPKAMLVKRDFADKIADPDL